MGELIVERLGSGKREPVKGSAIERNERPDSLSTAMSTNLGELHMFAPTLEPVDGTRRL